MWPHKQGFPKLQPFTKYVRLSLVFPCEIAHYGKNLISVFQEFFASINKILILAGRLSTRLLFYEVFRVLWYFLIQIWWELEIWCRFDWYVFSTMHSDLVTELFNKETKDTPSPFHCSFSTNINSILTLGLIRSIHIPCLTLVKDRNHISKPLQSMRSWQKVVKNSICHI